MYCQHCGLDANINENKLAKQFETGLATLEKQITKLSTSKHNLETKLSTLEGSSDKYSKISTKIKELEEEISKLEKERDTYLSKEDYLNLANSNDINRAYICPRCGHLIKGNLTENDIKELSQASHAQIHRAKNKFASGMVALMTGMIFTCICFLFLSMSFKATNGFQLVTNCVEFNVFIGLLVIGVTLLSIGVVFFVMGILNGKKYQNLLKDIQNGVFHQ